MHAFDRRTALKYLLALFASGIDRRSFAEESTDGPFPPSVASSGSGDGPVAANEVSNFKTVYSDPQLRARFYLFLQNIYHLYPEDRFHQLIIDISSQYSSDREIYKKLQERLREIKPLFSELTYALPALAKQAERGNGP